MAIFECEPFFSISAISIVVQCAMHLKDVAFILFYHLR
jgi:hypothetical protein